MSNMPNRPDPGQPPRPPRLRLPNWVIPVLLLFFVSWFLLRVPSIFSAAANAPIDVPYSVLYDQTDSDNVSRIVMEGSQVSGEFKAAVTYPALGSQEAKATLPATSKEFTTTLPPFADNDLIPLLRKHGVTIVNSDPAPSTLLVLLLNYGPLLLIAGLLFWSFSRSRQQQGTIFGFGQSKARRYNEERPKVTFPDVE